MSTDPASTVVEVLAARAVATPDSEAYCSEAAPGQWHCLTWRRFADRVGQVQRSLLAAGMQPGDRLAIIAPVSLEWELLHHAALGIGAVVIGLDAHDLPERLATMCEQAGVTAFAVSSAAPLGALAEERLRGARFVLDLGGAGPPLGPRGIGWAAFEELGKSAPAAPPAPTPEMLATIIFTSGTTGQPKAIPYTHGQVCLAAATIARAFGFVGAGSRLLCWLPLSNLFQRMVNLAGVINGSATHLLADPRRVMEAVGRVAPDVFIGVPRFYEKLYQGLRQRVQAQPWPLRQLAAWAWAIGRVASRRELAAMRIPVWLRVARIAADRLVLARIRATMGSRLRCLVTGSAPTPAHLLHEFHALGWLLLEAYGLSENVLPMAMNTVEDFRFGTVGKPLPGNEIRIGEEGAIRVRGPGLYRACPGIPGAPVDSEGFLATGDLGQFDADGYLRLAGRLSEIIKTSTGRRVSPLGVEARLRAVPGVDQAVLIGEGRKCLVALCSRAADVPGVDSDRLAEAIRAEAASMSSHERPRAVAVIGRPFTIESGELTPNLKLRRGAIETLHRAAVEALYAAVDSDRGGPRTGSDPVEVLFL